MKKIILLIFAVTSLNTFGQSTILITNNGTSMSLTPNATITEVTTANGNTKTYLDIKNTSGSSQSYSAKRYDLMLNAAGGTTASAYFCFAGNCYGDNVFVSPNALTLNAGQSASQLPGSFNMLIADLDEANGVGISTVKYTFFNTVTIGDSVQVTIKYNAPAGVNQTSNVFSSFDLSPNPVNDLATFRINSSKAIDTKLYIYNALGAIVNEKPVTLAEGKNKIDFSAETLPSGVYFACIKSGTSSTTKKFIVR